MKHLKDIGNFKLYESTISKNIKINRRDEDYRDAINYYNQPYYNFPTTVSIDDKKFIVGFGTSDRITIIDNSKYNFPDNEVYILGKHFGLNYISLYVIDLDKDTVNDIFLDDSDLSNEENFCYNLLDKEEKEQLNILLEYF
jgi:hypothetical protein